MDEPCCHLLVRQDHGGVSQYVWRHIAAIHVEYCRANSLLYMAREMDRQLLEAFGWVSKNRIWSCNPLPEPRYPLTERSDDD